MVKFGLMQMPLPLKQTVSAAWKTKWHQYRWLYKTLSSASKCEVLVLPEIWNGPYSRLYFGKFAERIPPLLTHPLQHIKMTAADITKLINSDEEEKGKELEQLTNGYATSAVLSAIAEYFGVYVMGGTIVEVDEQGKLYNTFTAYDPHGTLLQTYRKCHLFDVNIPNQLRFFESDVLSAGKTLQMVDLPWGKMGVAICYDLRFPEVAIVLRQMGAKYLLYPSNFNAATGPTAYELLLRARAIDSQCYVIGCSCAVASQQEDTTIDLTKEFAAYGHTTIVDPWGVTIFDGGVESGYWNIEVDEEEVQRVRSAIPVFTQKRSDLYETKYFH